MGMAMIRAHGIILFVLSFAAVAASAQSTMPTTAPLDYYRDLFVGSYDRGHHKDSKWDAASRRALDANARMWQANDGEVEDERDVILDAGGQAVDAGCDDPVVLYALARAKA